MARAGTLSCRVKEATAGVATVGALPLGFKVKLGLVGGKYIPAGLHAAEASCVSSSSLSAIRAAIVREVWSSKMPLANTLAVPNLLDGPAGVDPAFHIVWNRFRMMRRYLAYFPDEEPKIFMMLDLISRGAPCHGPVQLLLIHAAELGFAWDGDDKRWVRPSLPPLEDVGWSYPTFLFFHLGYNVFVKLSESEGFRSVQVAVSEESLQLPFSSRLSERDKNVVKSHVVWWGLERIPSWSGQEGRRSLSIFWQERWRWSFVLGMFLSTVIAC